MQTKELLMTNLANEKPSDDIDFWHQGEVRPKRAGQVTCLLIFCQWLRNMGIFQVLT